VNWLELYRKHLESRHLVPGTVNEELMRIGNFVAWLKGRASGPDDLRDIGMEDLGEYHTALERKRKPNGQPNSVQYTNRQIWCIERFYEFLHIRGLVLLNPFKDLPQLRSPRRLLRGVLSAAQVMRLLQQPNVLDPLGFRDRAMLELLYSCGLRSLELCRLSIYDLDLEKCFVSVKQGKGKKDRVVPVGKAAANYVGEYLRAVRPVLLADNPKAVEGIDRLFLNSEGRGMRRTVLYRIIKRYAYAAYLPEHTSAHSLRHACASEMLRGVASVRHVQEMLGHAQLTTTQLYTRVLPADLQKVHRKTAPSERSKKVPPATFEMRSWRDRKNGK
jgi:integrase/recombinase XerD